MVAETRVRDLDGRLRQVRASGPTAAAARSRLMERIRERPSSRAPVCSRPTSSFADLADLWLADLELRDLAGNTKENYRTMPAAPRPAGVRALHARGGDHRPGRVVPGKQAKVSPSQAKQTRTLLNMLFGFALRHDAIARNPVEGTSQLRRAKSDAAGADDRADRRDPRGRRELAKRARSPRPQAGRPGPRHHRGPARNRHAPGEVLALRPCDIEDLPTGMVASVNGTVVQRKGSGAERQQRPKTDASIRRIPVPEFAAVVLRRRLAGMPERPGPGRSSPAAAEVRSARTTSAARSGSSSQIAGLGDSGISLRWYRRTGATVIARGIGTDAAAAFLGHTSTVITEGHYIEPDRAVDPTPAAHLERTLRPAEPDGSLLANRPADREDELLAAVDREGDDDAVA